MTKTEIIKKVLNHENIPTVPYAINLAPEGYRVYGERLLEQYATEQIKQDYARGIFTLPQAVSMSIGNYMLYVSAPWWDWYNLPPYFFDDDTPEEMPTTRGTGNYGEFFEKLKYIKEHYDVYILVTVWGSHWEKAYFARGIENFLCDMAAEPQWAKQLLDMIIRKNLVMLENILPCEHIDGVLLGSDWGTQRDLIMSPECFRTMLKDGEKQEYDLLRKYGKDVFVHSCGKIDRILDDLVEIGMQCLNPVQPECTDLRWLKETYGSVLSFYGGISTQKTLPYGTPEDVTRETDETVALMRQGGGYITAPSQEIQEDVPYENLIALIEAAKKWAGEH